MDVKLEQQLSQQIQQILSAVSVSAIGVRELIPNALYVTGPATGTIPNKIKSFNIINLGLGGNNAAWSDIAVTGIVGITTINSGLKIFGYSIENDQNKIRGNIIVTPASGHIVLLQYLL